MLVVCLGEGDRGRHEFVRSDYQQFVERSGVHDMVLRMAQEKQKNLLWNRMSWATRLRAVLER
jgi:hypothetical protein